MSVAPEGAVSLSSLSIPQLDALQKTLSEEVEFFGESLEELRTVQQKFQNSQESVERLASSKSRQEILVPLTSMMYVPGQLTSPEKVTVELGTGYYLDLPTREAEEFFKRRIKYITTQMETVHNIGQEKSRMLSIVSEQLRTKVEQRLRAQQRPDAS